MFVVVFAHAIEVTPISMRQGGIILMEMSLYMAEKGFSHTISLTMEAIKRRLTPHTVCPILYAPHTICAIKTI